MKLISRAMCSGCIEAKAILKSQDIEYIEYDTQTIDGMALLSRYFDGPDTLLPAIICESHKDMEIIWELLPDVNVAVSRTW